MILLFDGLICANDYRLVMAVIIRQGSARRRAVLLLPFSFKKNNNSFPMVVFGTRYFENERARVRLCALLLFSLFVFRSCCCFMCRSHQKNTFIFQLFMFFSERETEWKRERNGVKTQKREKNILSLLTLIFGGFIILVCKPCAIIND